MLLPLLTVSFLMAMFFPVKFREPAPKIPLDKKAFYIVYMQSKEWKRFRRYRVKLDKGKCVRFHLLPVRKGLQVHHTTYIRLGCELMEDAETLCIKHHRKEHRK
jgi:hypothetical protein